MLSLCIICRDDEKHVQRLVSTAREHVAEIVCVDTGSIDRSAQVARDAGADVVIEAPELLDNTGVLRSFSEARQLSYSAATQPWRLWLDTDDDLSDWSMLDRIVTLADKSREQHPGFNVRMWYDYSWSADRSRCLQSFTRVRLTHRDDGWTWKRPIPEYLEYSCKDTYAEIDFPRVIHLSQGARGCTNDRNLHILRNWEANGGVDEDPVALYYYLGDEMLERERFHEAFEYFNKVPDTAPMLWQSRSTFRAARALMGAKSYDDAAMYIQKALCRGIQGADLYWELARALAALGNSDAAKAIMIASEDVSPIVGENPMLRDLMRSHLGMTSSS